MKTRTKIHNEAGNALVSLTAAVALLLVVISAGVNSDFGDYYIRGDSGSLIGSMDIPVVVNSEVKVFGGWVNSHGKVDDLNQTFITYKLQPEIKNLQRELSSLESSAELWLETANSETCVYYDLHTPQAKSVNQPQTSYILWPPFFNFQPGIVSSNVVGTCNGKPMFPSRKSLCDKALTAYFYGKNDPSAAVCLAGPDSNGKPQLTIVETYFLPQLQVPDIRF